MASLILAQSVTSALKTQSNLHHAQQEKLLIEDMLLYVSLSKKILQLVQPATGVLVAAMDPNMNAKSVSIVL